MVNGLNENSMPAMSGCSTSQIVDLIAELTFDKAMLTSSFYSSDNMLITFYFIHRGLYPRCYNGRLQV